MFLNYFKLLRPGPLLPWHSAVLDRWLYQLILRERKRKGCHLNFSVGYVNTTRNRYFKSVFIIKDVITSGLQTAAFSSLPGRPYFRSGVASFSLCRLFCSACVWNPTGASFVLLHWNFTRESCWLAGRYFPMFLSLRNHEWDTIHNMNGYPPPPGTL